MNQISTIIRARLNEGRSISDEDVLRLLAERDTLKDAIGDLLRWQGKKMSDDLAEWLRSQVDDDQTLAENDYDIIISARKVRDAAVEITRLRAALATARQEGVEEAAREAKIMASVLSSPSAQNALRFFADTIRAGRGEER